MQLLPSHVSQFLTDTCTPLSLTFLKVENAYTIGESESNIETTALWKASLFDPVNLDENCWVKTLIQPETTIISGVL